MKGKMIFSSVVRLVAVAAIATLTACGGKLDSYISSGEELSLQEGVSLATGAEYENFVLKGQALTSEGGEAAVLFHSDGESGYEITIRNGAQDGSI
ncbi:MAG: hypothetical protein IKL12_04710, partial [Alistipes sp.]|nr:hypothetical protein [Alistipes sp.]